MPYFACTAFFTAHSRGWSETYYNEAVDHTEARGRFVNLMVERSKMMPVTVKTEGARISQVGAPRDSLLIAPTATWATGHYQDFANADVEINVATDSLLVEFRSDPKYKNRKFIRGLPDEIVTGQAIIADAGDFNVGFAAWRALLIAGEIQGWRLRNKQANGAIVYQPIVDVVQVRVTARKTGRPFGQYPGRRKTTRKGAILAAKRAISSGLVTPQELGSLPPATLPPLN